jgi:hypothetical protein
LHRTDHGFCDGAQHQRQDRFRESPFDTAIFILQNDAAAAAWPVTDSIREELWKAMAQGKPSAAGGGWGGVMGMLIMMLLMMMTMMSMMMSMMMKTTMTMMTMQPLQLQDISHFLSCRPPPARPPRWRRLGRRGWCMVMMMMRVVTAAVVVVVVVVTTTMISTTVIMCMKVGDVALCVWKGKMVWFAR